MILLAANKNVARHVSPSAHGLDNETFTLTVLSEFWDFHCVRNGFSHR